MYRILLITIIVLIAVGALMTIAQIWGFGLSWDTYIKAIITDGILVVVLGLLMVLKADLGEHKKLKDENYLD